MEGPESIDENRTAFYAIDIRNTNRVDYAWSVDPPSAGTFTNSTMANAIFHAGEVTDETPVIISVDITGWKIEPTVFTKDVVIIDTNPIPVNQMPQASASSDKTKIGHGQSVQFLNNSTDPDGDDDIVKWEWDFSYNENDGFNIHSEEYEPLWQFNDPGFYNVQLRVTDKYEAISMLAQPLLIEVVENYAPVISAVSHSRTTSRAGNNNEAVQLGVIFTDSAPVDDTHICFWTCSYSSFDDPASFTPTWFPPDMVAKCEISVQVTDWFGLSDQGSCHQWFTSLPILNNSSVPDNLLPSHNLSNAFGGIVNPATYRFPNYPANGKVVFINYWATYSSGSTDSIPILMGIYDLFKNDEYVHLMINEGETDSDVVSFVNLNLYEASFWALDMDASYFSMTKGWTSNSNLIPQSLLFDRDGHCRWVHTGKITNTGDLQSAIEELL